MVVGGGNGLGGVMSGALAKWLADCLWGAGFWGGGKAERLAVCLWGGVCAVGKAADCLWRAGFARPRFLKQTSVF